MREFCEFAAAALAAGICFSGFAAAAQAQYLIVGNDEKLFFDDGKVVLHPPGKDTVSIIDIRDGAKPRIVVTLPLENSVAGPPPTSPSPRTESLRWSPILSTWSRTVTL